LTPWKVVSLASIGHQIAPLIVRRRTMIGKANRESGRSCNRSLNKHPSFKAWVITAVLCCLSIVTIPLAAGSRLVEQDALVWIGPGGTPLPFKSNAEIEEFLRTADVLEMENITIGVTHPRRVLLEKNGIQAKACFRDVDVYKQQVHLAKRGVRRHWRDCCMFECAAYELAKLLGLNNIPPVVARRIKRTDGTLQIWVENAFMEKDRARQKVSPPNPRRHKMQWQVMRIFDALIYNDDRNAGNILYDSNWNVWMIDHTRSFSQISELPQPTGIKYCEKNLWERLRSLDEEVVKDHIGRYLESAELKALLRRHEKLVTYIEDQIAQRGAKQVLFRFY